MTLPKLVEQIGERIAYQAFVYAGGDVALLPQTPEGWRARYRISEGRGEYEVLDSWIKVAEKSACPGLHFATMYQAIQSANKESPPYKRLHYTRIAWNRHVEIKSYEEGERVLEILSRVPIEQRFVLDAMLTIAQTPQELAFIRVHRDATPKIRKKALAAIANQLEI